MITLENKFLRVNISSGRSMRIESYFDKIRNKEWVWKPENSSGDPNESLDLKASFDPHWAGGWEEVFPNDAPCEINGQQLVDHGEVWRRNWELGKSNERSVTGHFTCETLPLELKKTISLHESKPEVMLSYEIKNLSSESHPYIFKFHPALKIEEGDRFVLPQPMMKPIALAFSRLLSDANEVPFPTGRNNQGGVISIDQVKKKDGYSREFVRLSQLKEGKCSLYSHQTNTELLMEFPLKEMPYVWLFQSFGGFMDHYVAMLEPTNAAHYDLAQLYQEKRADLIEGHGKKSFDIKISVREL